MGILNFGEGFPYTNFHDLNLDWIIKIAKDFLDQYTHIQEVIEEGEESLQNLTTSGLEQLQEKADALEELLQAWYNEHSEDIADQLASALSDLNDWYTEHSNDIAGELADALEDINSELADAITSFNAYAEEKATETIQTIPADYSTLSAEVLSLLKQPDAHDIKEMWDYGYYDTDGQYNNYEYAWHCRPFNVSTLSEIVVQTTRAVRVVFFDTTYSNVIDYTVIQTSGWHLIEIPENAINCIISITDSAPSDIENLHIFVRYQGNIDSIYDSTVFPKNNKFPNYNSRNGSDGYFEEWISDEGVYSPTIHDGSVIRRKNGFTSNDFVCIAYSKDTRYSYAAFVNPVSKYVKFYKWDILGIATYIDNISFTYGDLDDLDISITDTLRFYYNSTGIYIEVIQSGIVVSRKLVLASSSNKVLSALMGYTPCIGILAFSVSDNKLFYYFNDWNESGMKVTKRRFLIIGDSYADTRLGETKWPTYTKQYLNVPNMDWINVAISGTGFTAGTNETNYLGQLKSVDALQYRYSITDILVTGGLNDSKAGLSTSAELQTALATAITNFNTYAREYYPNARIHVLYVGNALDYMDDYEGARRFYNERLYCRKMYNDYCALFGWIPHPFTEYAFAGSVALYYSDGVHPSLEGYQNITNTSTAGDGAKAVGRAIALALMGNSVETFTTKFSSNLTGNAEAGVSSISSMYSQQINDKIYLTFEENVLHIAGTNMTLDSTFRKFGSFEFNYFNKEHDRTVNAFVTTTEALTVPVVLEFKGYDINIKTVNSSQSITGITNIVIRESEFVESADFVV